MKLIKTFISYLRLFPCGKNESFIDIIIIFVLIFSLMTYTLAFLTKMNLSIYHKSNIISNRQHIERWIKNFHYSIEVKRSRVEAIQLKFALDKPYNLKCTCGPQQYAVHQKLWIPNRINSFIKIFFWSTYPINAQNNQRKT